MKSRRQVAIKDILFNQRIATQDEILSALRARGYNVTQATVSRDIKELGLIRVPDGEGYRYAFPETYSPKTSFERMQRVFRDSVVSYDYSENIIVIKTLPGAAQSIGSLIDALDSQYILGSVGGDDTVFIVVKPKQKVTEVMKYFRQILE